MSVIFSLGHVCFWCQGNIVFQFSLSFISTLIFFISFCLLSVSFALLFPVKKLAPRLLVFTDALALGQLFLKVTVKLGEEAWVQGK